MKLQNKIGFVFLILLNCTNLFSESKKLTLPQAIEQGLKANFDIIRAANISAIQEVGITSAKWALIPTINISTSGSQNKKSKVDVIDGFLNTPNPSNSFSSNFNTSVVLFDGMNNWENVSKATNTFEASNLDFIRTKQLVVFEVNRRFFTLLRNKSLLQVSEDNLKRSQQQLKRIDESNKVGALSKAEFYRQQVSTANDELSLIRAKNNYDNSVADLLTYLSLDVTEEYEIEDYNIEKEIEETNVNQYLQEYSNADNVSEISIASRSDYSSAILNVTNASSDITIANSTYWPTISANAGFSMSADTLTNLGKKSNANFGLSFSFPIFSGFRTSVAVEQAKLRLHTAEEQLHQTKRRIQVEVKKAILDLESAHKQREVSQKNIIASNEDRRIAEERYTLGAGTLLDLLIANANNTRALSDKVNADYDFLIAKQQLILAVGKERY